MTGSGTPTVGTQPMGFAQALLIQAWRSLRLTQQHLRYWRSVLRVLPPGAGASGSFAHDWLDVAVQRMELREPWRLRPGYSFAAAHAAYGARNLGHGRIALVGFGAGGGRGLATLDRLAPLIQATFGLEVEVHGFDGNLPPGPDACTAPARLHRTRLHQGDLGIALPAFIASAPAPIALIACDLDHGATAVPGLAALEIPAALRLPRMVCCFDDAIGLRYARFSGEVTAIREFNRRSPRLQISRIRDLRRFIRGAWHDQDWPGRIYLARDPDHPLCDRPDGMALVPERPVNHR